MTSSHLAHTLVEDPDRLAATGYTWHIVGCIDPDGMRLNEGWLSGPFTRSHYGRHFYRPAPDEQVEWTFPFAYKDSYFDAMLPETVALMRLIDDTRPAFMCSLHNGEFGGVYYYLSSPEPPLYDTLQAIPRAVGLALDTGEPEVAYAEEFADGIFSMIRNEDAYEFMLGAGLDPQPPAGTSSADYASKYDTLTLVSEVPYWTNPASGDVSPTDLSYADALAARARGLHEMATVLADVLTTVTPELTTESAYLRASRAFVPMMSESASAAEHRSRLAETNRPATAAEVFSCDDLVHCFRLRYGGMLLRALDAELATGNASPLVR
ncbi:MAG: M14 family zinc carboxypeptidase, partial [Actinomycetes bacterium]